MAGTCNVCAGSGNIVPHGVECPTCRGVGKVRTKESITVDIPVGTCIGCLLKCPADKF